MRLTLYYCDKKKFTFDTVTYTNIYIILHVV